MEEEKRGYRKYDKEFVVQAVKQVVDVGRSVSEVAKALGMHESVLRRWKREYLKDPMNAFPGKGHLTVRDEEISKLRKSLERAERDREIFKKAVGIFSKIPQ